MSGAVIAWLVSALGRLKQGVEALVAFAARHPWQALCTALALAAVLSWRGEQRALRHYRAAQSEIEAMRGASKTAAALADAQRKADEAHYKELAHDADAHYRAQDADARAATAAFVRAHRLPPDSQGRTGAPFAQAQDGGAGVSAQPAAQAELVAVTAADVNTCAADYSYAKAAYDWANALSE